MNTETQPIKSLYHSFEREDRKAEVWRNSNGFYVELYKRGLIIHDWGTTDGTLDWQLVETREVYEHSEYYAENCAENFVDGVYDV
tara:strand:- start:178 stop:432 length:255 start_codon:yes stop_codon:yes gene_type:complete